MNEQRIASVIPVKSFHEAKQRLHAVLSYGERRRLAQAMFEDVLNVLTQCPGLAAIYVVTSDPLASRLAQAQGARVLPDPMDGGLSGAVASAAQALKAQGMDGMLVVPADVPSINVETVHALLDAHALPRAVTLAAAGRDGGTNALLCSPPDVIPNSFGHNSFRAHCQLAASSGITPNIMSLPSLRYDIDRPLDLLSFLSSPSRTRTYRYLVHSRIAQRLISARNFPSSDSLRPQTMPAPVQTCLQKG